MLSFLERVVMVSRYLLIALAVSLGLAFFFEMTMLSPDFLMFVDSVVGLIVLVLAAAGWLWGVDKLRGYLKAKKRPLR